MTTDLPVRLHTDAVHDEAQAQLAPNGELVLASQLGARIALTGLATAQLRDLLNGPHEASAAPADPPAPLGDPYKPITGHDTFVVVIASTASSVAAQVADDLRRYIRDSLPAHVVTAAGMPL